MDVNRIMGTISSVVSSQIIQYNHAVVEKSEIVTGTI